uniref:ARAD1B19932p n=1 Tax=Blastobotrys adeninivorans TaxID=409370 RepID=A0A060T734_BLAAD
MALEKRATVFRPVLDNPYTKVEWPSVSDGEKLTELLCALLEPVGVYNEIKKKHNQDAKRPKVLESVTIGFNSTTKAVEDQVDISRKSDKELERQHDDVSVVFVPRSDIAPVLSGHFPVLCAVASIRAPVKLIQLPKGSLSRIANAVGDDSCMGIVGLRTGEGTDIEGFKELSDLVNQVAQVNIPWLRSIMSTGFKKPNIKGLKTTAPMKKGGKKKN